MEVLIEKYHGRLQAYFRRRVRDPFQVEDLLQEVYLKIFLGLPQTAPDNLEAWIMTIAKYTLYDFYRKQKYQFLLADYEELLQMASEENIAADFERKQQLKVIQRLPLKLHRPLLLAVRGFSYSEIAEILAVSESTVKSRIHQARQKLKLERKEENG